MSLFSLEAFASELPQAWKSRVLAKVGAASIKVLRMDGTPASAEVHDYNEGLLVLAGRLCLEVRGAPVTVEKGEIYIAEAGVPHTILPDSHGTLVIIDLD